MKEEEWLECDEPARMFPVLSHLVPRGGVGPKADRAYHVSDRKLRLFAVACCRRAWHLLDDACRLAVKVAERVADDCVRADELNYVRDRIETAPPGLPLSRHVQAVRWLCSPSAVNAIRAAGCVRDALDADTGSGSARQNAIHANLLRDIVGNPFRPVTLPMGPTEVRCDKCGRANPTVTFSDMRCLGCGRGIARLQPGSCSWLTPTVLSLAQATYEDRDWERLLAVADALEEAGCPAEEMCPTCRGKGEVSSPPGLEELLDEEAGKDTKTVAGCYLICPWCGGTRHVPHPILSHLHSPGPHVRGCWALDLVLGKE